MAGKLHVNLVQYQTSIGRAILPGGRRARAYAEGYQANRKVVARAANPFPAWQNTDPVSDWTAWNQGWLDANIPGDPTHVGKPISAGGLVP